MNTMRLYGNPQGWQSRYQQDIHQQLQDDESAFALAGGGGDAGQVTDDDYVVKGGDATKRKDTAPYAADTGTVPQGSIVTWRGESDDKKFVKVELSDKSITWLSKADIADVDEVTDANEYCIAYNDVFLYKDPIGTTKSKVTTYDKRTTGTGSAKVNEKVTLDTKVKIYHRSGGMVHVRGTDVAQTDYGWIKEGDLFSKAQQDRDTYLDEYRTWLTERLTELTALDAKQMMEQAKAFLGEIEKNAVQINKNVYPRIADMSKTPTFAEGTDRTYVPPELIGVTRKFIEVLERTPPAPKDPANAAAESASSVTGGSLYDNIDWNKRLGVPSYHTQSDNLMSPEATCVPTSLTMILERLGMNREDILNAIDSKLPPGKTLDQWWEDQSKDYMKKENAVFEAEANNKKRNEMLAANKKVDDENIELQKQNKPLKEHPYKDADIPAEIVLPTNDKNQRIKTRNFPNDGDNYQRLRGGTSGGMVGKEADLAKKFRAKAQSEDLLGFLGFILGYNVRQELPNANLVNLIGGTSGAASKYTLTTLDKWSSESRKKIRDTLNAGGAVMLGVSHKAGTTGGHVVTVQNVTDTGLVIDDPYGKGNPEYRWTTPTADLYKKHPGDKSRSSEFRNQTHFDPSGKIDDQDFWAGKSQNLDTDESLGNSSFFSYEMLDNDETFINYITLYKRPQ